MNTNYFACQTCKSYIDAGYRWCYWQLEHTGIVNRGQAFSLDAVLQADQYWRGVEEAEWLRKLLPQVREYLLQHKDHYLVYGEGEDFLSYDDISFLDWLGEEGFVLDLLPRYFAERLGYTLWQQVTEHIEKLESPPFWWGLPEFREAEKEKFETSVRKLKSRSV